MVDKCNNVVSKIITQRKENNYVLRHIITIILKS